MCFDGKFRYTLCTLGTPDTLGTLDIGHTGHTDHTGYTRLSTLTARRGRSRSGVLGHMAARHATSAGVSSTGVSRSEPGVQRQSGTDSGTCTVPRRNARTSKRSPERGKRKGKRKNGAPCIRNHAIVAGEKGAFQSSAQKRYHGRKGDTRTRRKRMTKNERRCVYPRQTSFRQPGKVAATGRHLERGNTPKPHQQHNTTEHRMRKADQQHTWEVDAVTIVALKKRMRERGHILFSTNDFSKR